MSIVNTNRGFNERISKMWMYIPTVFHVTPLLKIDQRPHEYSCITTWSRTLSHSDFELHYISSEKWYPPSLESYSSLANGFSDFLFSSLTSYFEGGERRYVMGRNDDGMVWVFSKGISCLICRGGKTVSSYEHQNESNKNGGSENNVKWYKIGQAKLCNAVIIWL